MAERFSGTVAAAREAAVLGSRGMAFSQYVRDDVDLEDTSAER